MTRAFGYWKKILHDLETLRRQREKDEGKTLADAMRHYANNREYPADPVLRGQLKWHQLAARAIANTVPKAPNPPSQPCCLDRGVGSCSRPCQWSGSCSAYIQTGSGQGRGSVPRLAWGNGVHQDS
jgi:hypothetical protein